MSVIVALSAAAWSNSNSWTSTTDLPAESSALPRYLRGVWPLPVQVVRKNGLGFGVSGIEVMCNDSADVRLGEEDTSSSAPGPSRVIWRMSFGWPVRCLFHDVFGVAAGLPAQQTRSILNDAVARGGRRVGVSFPNWAPIDRGETRLMPRAVLWSGLVINTALYGTALLVFVGGAPVVRRFHRRRRGQCEWCGYPAGVSAVCTECGATLRASESGRRV